MGLFEEKLKNIIPAAGKGQSSAGNEPDTYEEEYRALKAKKSKLILRLGEKYYEDHKYEDPLTCLYAQEITDILNVERDMGMTEKRKLAAQGIRLCESCGAKLPISSVFCNKCGSRQGELESEVVRASHICPKCGTKLEDGDIFCVGCGYKL